MGIIDIDETINRRFQSGNSIAVDGVRITKEEWTLIQKNIDQLVNHRDILAKCVKQALFITSEYEDNDTCIGDCLDKMDRWSTRVMGKSKEWDALMAAQDYYNDQP